MIKHTCFYPHQKKKKKNAVFYALNAEKHILDFISLDFMLTHGTIKPA